MEGESLNITSERIEKLKQLFPETITEGKIDWEKLQASLGKENIEFRNERYVLNWLLSSMVKRKFTLLLRQNQLIRN